VFLVIDLIMFYVFFESILPPLFVLIGLYGASQKFRAGYYLFLFTLMGSLFMLLSFVKIGGDTATSAFIGYTNHTANTLLQEIIWVVLFVSFSVKTPLVPVHTWLPLAHSDANVSGSIILASIVLKLALYGFIRILIAIFIFATLSLTPFFLGLCAISLLYSSFTTIRQFDLKVLVAYSSIAHMASSLLGTFSDTLYGLIGSVIFGLAHGFVSPGLFIIVGAVLYDRCGSRILNYYRGLNLLMPVSGLLFLLLVFGNMGVPLTGNFIGEFLSLLGAYQQNMFIASIGTISVILSAVYSIFMYNRVTGGSLSPYIHTIPDIFRKEFYLLMPLLILTIILGVYPQFISSEIEYGLSNLLFIGGIPISWRLKLHKNPNQRSQSTPPREEHKAVNNSWSDSEDECVEVETENIDSDSDIPLPKDPKEPPKVWTTVDGPPGRVRGPRWTPDKTSETETIEQTNEIIEQTNLNQGGSSPSPNQTSEQNSSDIEIISPIPQRPNSNSIL
jgi:NADH-ubiquinone oxidoreductase chain 4